MNKKLFKFTFCLLFIISSFLFLSACSLFKEEKAKYDGTLTVEYVLEDGTVKKSVECHFNTGVTWKELLDEYFENVTWDSNGTMVMTLEDYETPQDWSTFLCIYVDGEQSTVGITQLEIKDGLKVQFKVEKMIW